MTEIRRRGPGGVFQPVPMGGAPLPEPRNAVSEALRAICSEPGDEGEIPYSECTDRLQWSGPRRPSRDVIS